MYIYIYIHTYITLSNCSAPPSPGFSLFCETILPCAPLSHFETTFSSL